jgi:hypothetical protein
MQQVSRLLNVTGRLEGIGTYHDPQIEFYDFLNHTSAVALCEPYLASTAIAQAAGKPFLMFETNSASCGGFPGISDSFGAALWALDYGLQVRFTLATFEDVLG